MMKKRTTMRRVGVAVEMGNTFPSSPVHWIASAQPGMKPGFLKNQMMTMDTNRVNVAISWKETGPRA